MASKQLTANVRLNTKSAETSLSNLIKKINNVNNAVNKISNGSSAKLPKNIQNTTNETHKWANAISKVNSKLNGSKSLIGSIGSGLKTLANRYLGVMGMGVVINTSDAITSAENKLNYINGGDTALTQDAMSKMYTSAQKVRMGYTDMMSNVSKSMALAGDSFKGSTDMAIRFQEIMAEAYAVGGASAQEMSSSMYQLIQALGAGTLAGDELRSVREGAPLAYKEIEKFAQGVYNTTDSLKDMASEGKISSDMVIAAVMNAGDKMDSAFAQTEQTFGQTWDQIKNAATRSFTPIAEYFRTALNNAIDNGLIEKFETFFSAVAKGVIIVFKIIENVINWIAENWNWLKNILIAGLILYISYLIITTSIAIANAISRIAVWLMEYGTILLIVACVLALVYVFYLWKTAAIDTCTAIAIALLIIAVICFFIFGWVVALVVAAVAVVIMALQYIAGAITWLAMLIWNTILAIANFFAAIGLWVAAVFGNVCEWISTAFMNAVNFVRNVAMGLWNVIKAIAQNIGIAFENCWIFAQNTFWSFVESVLRGLQALVQPISDLASLIGLDFSLNSTIDSVAAKQQSYKDFVDVGDAWNEGYNTYDYKKGNYTDLGNAWDKGINTFDAFEDGWSSDAFNIGYDWGNGVKDSINQWGSQYQTWDTGGLSLDNIGNSLGVDNGQFDNLFDNNTVGNNIGNDFGDLLGDTGDIADNTGKISDSMDLTEEDLKYLRKIAESEWKKEYTTATINVDMTNNNNINSDSDLDGIVTRLSEKLREELNVVADGVYA